MIANITRQENSLFEALKPVVSSLGVELVDVDIRSHDGQQVVRVVIDSDEGIGIEDCGRISEQVTPVIELEDPKLLRNAQLEVTSPGVDRRLRRSDELQRYDGRRVNVKCYAPFREQKKWTGTIQSYTDDELTLKLDNDDSITIPMDKIASVRLDFDADKYLSTGGNNTDG